MRSKTFYLSFLPILTVLIIWIIVTFVPLFKGLFYFSFDQARDLIWVKNQIDFGKITLVGPSGSLTGVFFGPLWFWVLIIPYLITGGDPVGITVFNGLLILVTIFLAFFLFRKQAPLLAYFAILTGLLSPGLRSIAEYAFSQHMLPLLTLLLIFSYTQILLYTSKKYFLTAAFLIALMFHAEPATSIFSLPSLLLTVYFSPDKKRLLNPFLLLMGISIFTIPFLPQLLFDIRHDFIQTRSILSYLQGNNESLGGILPLTERVSDRTLKFFDVFRSATIQNPTIISILVFLTTIVSIIKEKKDKFVQSVWISSIIYIFSLWLFFVIYPPELKRFYLDGLLIIFTIIHAIALSILWKRKQLRIFLMVYLFFVFIESFSPMKQIELFKTNFSERYQHGGTFANQRNIVDSIYQDASGRGFFAYTYSSAIYDYPYQYLFLSHGIKKYGYLPEEFSYLPNQPEYVQYKNAQLQRLQDRIKPGDNLIYLVVDADNQLQRRTEWLKNFPTEKLPFIERRVFPDKTVVEKRSSYLK